MFSLHGTVYNSYGPDLIPPSQFSRFLKDLLSLIIWAEESNNSFNMHLLVAYCVAGNLLGAGDKLISKMRMVLTIIQLTDNDKKVIRRWALASGE